MKAKLTSTSAALRAVQKSYRDSAPATVKGNSDNPPSTSKNVNEASTRATSTYVESSDFVLQRVVGVAGVGE